MSPAFYAHVSMVSGQRREPRSAAMVDRSAGIGNRFDAGTFGTPEAICLHPALGRRECRPWLKPDVSIAHGKDGPQACRSLRLGDAN
jgi:hypothetical protein